MAFLRFPDLCMLMTQDLGFPPLASYPMLAPPDRQTDGRQTGSRLLSPPAFVE
jgi:hypothetical protein